EKADQAAGRLLRRREAPRPREDDTGDDLRAADADQPTVRRQLLRTLRQPAGPPVEPGLLLRPQARNAVEEPFGVVSRALPFEERSRELDQVLDRRDLGDRLAPLHRLAR